MSTKITARSREEIRRILASVLGDEPFVGQPFIDRCELAVVIADEDRVLPLVAHRLRAIGKVTDLPPCVQRVLQQSINDQAAVELALRPDIATLTDAFSHA